MAVKIVPNCFEPWHDRLFTVRDLSFHLQVSPRAIRVALSSGALPGKVMATHRNGTHSPQWAVEEEDFWDFNRDLKWSSGSAARTGDGRISATATSTSDLRYPPPPSYGRHPHTLRSIFDVAGCLGLPVNLVVHLARQNRLAGAVEIGGEWAFHPGILGLWQIGRDPRFQGTFRA